MKHVHAKHFWQVVEDIDTVTCKGPRGSRPIINIDMQETGCFTEVTLNGRLVGEEISHHPTSSIRHYLAEEV